MPRTAFHSAPVCRIILALFVFISIQELSAQGPDAIPTWTWVDGPAHDRADTVYGIPGSAHPDVSPSDHYFSTAWRCLDGTIWLLASTGFWKYDAGADEWTCVGDYRESKMSRFVERGTFHRDNLPGSRSFAAGWVDEQGDLWLYGGYGHNHGRNGSATGPLGDLWKFDVSEEAWGFVGGTDSTRVPPAYEDVPGVRSRFPGSRAYSACGVRPDGTFWLYGGSTDHVVTERNDHRFGDLWTFDPRTNRWSWIAGPDTADSRGSYRSGHPSPGGRMGAVGVWDADDRLWLFGGHGRGGVNDSVGDLNDLWLFEASSGEWSFVSGDTGIHGVYRYGELGQESEGNVPRPRWGGVMWMTPDERILLFGGVNRWRRGPVGIPNDMWSLNPETGAWTWVRGDSTEFSFGRYSRMGLTLPSNEAGGRFGAAHVIEPDGSLRLFGGQGYSVNFNIDAPERYNHQDFYDAATDRWTWVDGTRLSNGHVSDESSSTIDYPDFTTSNTSWIDQAGNLCYYDLGLREVWSFDPDREVWTRLYDPGDSLRFSFPSNFTSSRDGATKRMGAAVRDTAFTTSPDNTPGIMSDGHAWTDSADNLWLYGGYGRGQRTGEESFVVGYLSDMWMLELELGWWAWMTDTSVGSSDAPGFRSGCMTWRLDDGDLLLFGGWGRKLGQNDRYHNDLWRLDTKTAIWELQPPSQSQYDIPPGRSSAATCTGDSGIYYMMGGTCFTQLDSRVSREDLWSYNASMRKWTHIWGLLDDRTAGPPDYGVRGTADTSNTPGGRANATIWIGLDDNLYLFGGTFRNYDVYSVYNDLWRFDFETEMWTWLAGDSVPNPPRHIGAEKFPHPATRPAGDLQPYRERGAYSDASGPVWVLPDGTVWKFDGRDMWRLDWLKYSDATNVDAGPDVSICRGDTVDIGGDSKPGIRYVWSNGLGDSGLVRVSPRRSTTYYVGGHDSTDGSWSFDSITVSVRDRTDATFIYTLDRNRLTPTPFVSDVTVVEWDFGDGNQSTEESPEHLYDANGTYEVRLIAETDCGLDTAYSTIIVDGISSVSELPLVASDILLHPNPVNATSLLEFRVTESGPARVTILDVTGREMATLLNGRVTTGLHSLIVDPIGIELTKGVWLIRIEIGGTQYVIPMMFAR